MKSKSIFSNKFLIVAIILAAIIVFFVSTNYLEDKDKESVKKEITVEEARDILLDLTDYKKEELTHHQEDNYVKESIRDKYHIFWIEEENPIADYNYCVDKTSGEVFVGTPPEAENEDGLIIPYDEWVK